MGWVQKTLNSSIGKKYVMSITGLFLISFLLVHLLGNLLLLKEDGGLAFNEYAHFMKYNPLIKASEVILFAGFIFHSVQGISLIRSNRKARPQRYKVPYKNKKVSWYSQMTASFGVIILVFLIIHLWQFFRFKYLGGLSEVPGMPGVDNVYQEVVESFSGFEGVIWVPLYVMAMMIISFHLYHGFQSAFQTLGLNHKKYSPVITAIGVTYAIAIPLTFAVIPVVILFTNI